MSGTQATSNKKYIREGRVGIILGFGPVLLFGAATKNVIFALPSFFVVFMLPYFGWAGFADELAVRILRYFLVRRILDRVLPKALQERFMPRHYFRVASSYPSHLWGRFFQVLFLTFFFATLTVQHAQAIITPVTPLSTLAEFAFYGLLYVTFAGPIMGLVWVYQDWGLRGLDYGRGVAYPIGSTLVGYIAGFGTLGTSASFILARSQGSVLEAVGYALLLMVLLVPPCLIVCSIFHSGKEIEVHAKLSNNNDLSNSIELASLVLAPTNSHRESRSPSR